MAKNGNKDEDDNLDLENLDLENQQNDDENDDIENPFAVDFDEDADKDEEDWMNSFNVSDLQEEEEEQQEEEEEEEGDGELSLDDDNQEGDDEDEDEDEDDTLDLEAMNNKIGKDFKTKKEFYEFIEGKSKGDDSSPKDEVEVMRNEVTQSESDLSYFNEKLDLNDIDLMTTYYTELAVSEKKDIADPEVLAGINLQVEELEDNHSLGKTASGIRRKVEKLVRDIEVKKTQTETKIQTAIDNREKESKQKLKDSFLNLAKDKKFFGVDVSNDRLQKAFKSANKGKLIDDLKSDKNKLAEVAMFLELKAEIFKKGNGQTYSDGVKAILDEFDTKADKNTVAKAQKRGSSGSSENEKSKRDSFVS